MELDVSAAAIDLLGRAGFDPVYGARPLKRAVQTLLETPLAREILAGRFGPGDRIQATVKDDRLHFEAARGKVSAA
jgi:ATP-dependent Clp protease ATP-binding subunit ClpB